MHPITHSATAPRSRSDDSPSDEALLFGLGQGDPVAGTTFVRRYQGRVYGLARSIVGDSTQAEEVAQEALIRAWRRASSYDARRGSVSTWVLTITRNLAVDALRRKGARPADPQAVIFLEQPARIDARRRGNRHRRDQPGTDRSVPSTQRTATGPRPLRLVRLYGPRDQPGRGDPLGHGQGPCPSGPHEGAVASGSGGDKRVPIHAPDDCRIHPRTHKQSMKGTCR